MWDTPSFVIGLMIGLILMLIIVWALYAGRTFVFSICPKGRNFCNNRDYFDNPANALADGAKLDDILFINDQDQMYYKRVVKNRGCIPIGSRQTVKINHPQYCNFKGRDSQNYEGVNTEFGSRLYHMKTDNGTTYSVLTRDNCEVESSENNFVVSGRPMLKWRPSHLVN